MLRKTPVKSLQLFIITFLSFSVSFSQTISPVVKATLPSVLTESSGVEVIDRNNIWSHNDGGGNAELYNFDSTGTLLRTLVVLNATNVDWEDLAQDTLGNFYIGDFGNNTNDRQDLKIYIIPNPSLIIGDSTVAQTINYTYPDQTAFPPSNAFKNFDCEAMIALNDSLYLFSKDQSSPYSGYTKLYSLPATAGTYIANLLDSFYTGPGPALAYSITSADISPDRNHLALLGYSRLWLFSNFTGSDFFSGTVQQFTFSTTTQKEGVCFISNSEVYLTDELAFGTGQKLYYFDFTPYITGVSNVEMGNNEITIFPNPSSSEFIVSAPTSLVGSWLNIFDAKGNNVCSTILQTKNYKQGTKNLNAGTYFIQLLSEKQKPRFAKLIIQRRD